MRVKQLTFQFRWIPFAAAMFVMVVGIMLGNWQTRRAAEKIAIEHSITERGAQPSVDLNRPFSSSDIEYRRVSAEGVFMADWPVYLDNRPYQGKAGFTLMMPLRLTKADSVVLVARGWFPRNAAERTLLPGIPVPSGPVRIEGVAHYSAGHVLQLGQAAAIEPGAIVQNLEPTEFARVSKLPLQHFIIEQTSDTSDTLVRDWPQASAGVDKHRGYAFQWYALAATALVFFLVTGFRRAR
jgi:cytochrome oxidase assembly protein ShyY1